MTCRVLVAGVVFASVLSGVIARAESVPTIDGKMLVSSAPPFASDLSSHRSVYDGAGLTISGLSVSDDPNIRRSDCHS
jgi:hypothetical protein